MKDKQPTKRAYAEEFPITMSGALQVWNCPGSARMQQLAGDDAESEWAATGNKLHYAWETGDMTGLEEEECDIVLALLKEEKRIREEFGDFTEFRELEVWLQDRAGENIIPGTVDWVIFDKKIGVVMDAKTGWMPVSDESVAFQGSLYAAAVCQMFDLDSCSAIFYSPRLNRISATEVKREEVADIAIKAWGIRLAAEDDSQIQLRPSADACRFCRAKLFCPALHVAGRELAKVKRVESIELVPTPQLNKIKEQWQRIKKLGEVVDKEVKLRVKGKEPGIAWKLLSVEGREHIADSYGVFRVLKEITDEEFMAQCCSADLKKTRDFWLKKMMDADPNAKKEDLLEIFETRVAPFVKRGAGHDRLWPKKKGE